jgi:hypothetical protein
LAFDAVSAANSVRPRTNHGGSQRNPDTSPPSKAVLQGTGLNTSCTQEKFSMKRHPQTLLRIDRLEDRAVPSVTANWFQGTLTVEGSATTPGSQIRVVGQSGPIRVFDGPTEVGFFENVKNVAIWPAGGTQLNVDLGVGQELDSLDIAIKRGNNVVSIRGGVVQNVSILAGSGQDQIDILALSARNLSAEAGPQVDRVNIRKSGIGALRVNSAENISLQGSLFNSVSLNNISTAANVLSDASITGDFNIAQRGGSLTLNGMVGGNVAFSNTQAIAAADLIVNGWVKGGLQMVGSQFNDSAIFSSTSRIDGQFDVAMGAANDRLTLAGFVGTDRPSTKFLADLGTGNDSVSVLNSARIMASIAEIRLGDGLDRCSIAKKSYFAFLAVDGGVGTDVIEAFAHENLVHSGFETVM